MAWDIIERASGSVSESCSSGFVLEAVLRLVHASHLLAERGQFVLQLRIPRAELQQRQRAIGRVECRQIALDALFELLLALVDLAGREVPISAVDRLELAAVDGDNRL